MQHSLTPSDAKEYFAGIVGQYYKVLYLFPILLIIWCVFKYGMNVPFMDQWTIVDLLKLASEGNLNLSHLSMQHNEHRIILPKLIFLALGFVSKWNTLLEMLFGILLISAVFFHRINENALEGFLQNNRTIPRIALLVSGFLLFSLSQHENWLWGFQVTFFLVQALFALSVFVMTTTVIRSFVRRFIALRACIRYRFCERAALRAALSQNLYFTLARTAIL
jgi:hypothetical protein